MYIYITQHTHSLLVRLGSSWGSSSEGPPLSSASVFNPTAVSSRCNVGGEETLGCCLNTEMRDAPSHRILSRRHPHLPIRTWDEQQLHATKLNHSASPLHPCSANKTPGSRQKPSKNQCLEGFEASGWIIHNPSESQRNYTDGRTETHFWGHMLTFTLHTAINHWNHLDSVAFTDRKHSSILKTSLRSFFHNNNVTNVANDTDLLQTDSNQ